MIGWAAAAFALAVVVAGCGGSYTKRDFAARANAICASTVRATRSVAAPNFTGNGSHRLPATAAYLNKVLPLVQSEARKIRRLPVPSESAAQRVKLHKYLNALTRAVSEYRAMALAASHRATSDFASAETALGANPVTALATSYGLKSCGAPGATVR